MRGEHVINGPTDMGCAKTLGFVSGPEGVFWKCTSHMCSGLPKKHLRYEAKNTFCIMCSVQFVWGSLGTDRVEDSLAWFVKWSTNTSTRVTRIVC